MIKFLDLHAQYLSIKGEIDAAIANVIEGAAFVGGSFVPAFERDFAQWMRAPYCIGVGNGTDALEIAIEALGLAPGWEIIVPGNSFIATSEAVTRCGHRVVFAAPPASTQIGPPLFPAKQANDSPPGRIKMAEGAWFLVGCLVGPIIVATDLKL
jgi:DegT/DnrJ/EryC1/StrS aminotransferase family